MRGVILISGLADDVYTKEDYALIGVDHGAFVCASHGMHMAAAIGDFDSVTQAEFQQIQAMADTIIHLPSHKNETDTEEAIQYALAQGYEDILLYGALGGRLDHELANLYLLMHRDYPITLLNKQNRIQILKQGTYKVTKEYTYLSFLALEEAVISETGVAYPLTKQKLTPSDIFAVSNEIVDAYAMITVHEGKIIMIEAND